jgi:hypothetical protein
VTLKLKSSGFPILASREVNYNVPNVALEGSKLIFPETEGLDSIHTVLSRNNFMLLANEIKEIFIVI